MEEAASKIASEYAKEAKEHKKAVTMKSKEDMKLSLATKLCSKEMKRVEKEQINVGPVLFKLQAPAAQAKARSLQEVKDKHVKQLFTHVEDARCQSLIRAHLEALLDCPACSQPDCKNKVHKPNCFRAGGFSRMGREKREAAAMAALLCDEPTLKLKQGTTGALEFNRKVMREKAKEHGKQRAMQAIVKEATNAFKKVSHEIFAQEAKSADSMSFLQTVADVTGSS